MEPLASAIRPKTLSDFVGQEHLVGENKPLRVAIEQKHLFSFILWGPPGVGKTTLAKIYANAIDAELHELSAVSAGKEDIRHILNVPKLKVTSDKLKDGEILKRVQDDEKDSGQGTSDVPSQNDGITRPKILFLDEIHRFNKAQQDFLLPYVERGELTLIGATTENPSFEVIPALLSRCRVFVLNELSETDMRQVILQTGIKLDDEARNWLINMANGDARQAITMLENAQKLYGKITIESLKNTLQNKFLRFDKQGDEHYNTISAFIKSLRASQVDAALYYLARMVEAGEDPKFIARRMVVFASEDIGVAQPTALVVANAVFRAVETIGYPECAINLAHGVTYLAKCPKNRDSYNAYFAAVEDVKKFGNLPIPLKVRNAPTKLMKELDYGKGYEKYTQESFLPEKLARKQYWKSSIH